MEQKPSLKHSTCLQKKTGYVLQSVSGLSNYRATLEQQLVHLSNSPLMSDMVWMVRLSNLLNCWFRLESQMLSDDSVSLKEFFKQQDIQLKDK